MGVNRGGRDDDAYGGILVCISEDNFNRWLHPAVHKSSGANHVRGHFVTSLDMALILSRNVDIGDEMVAKMYWIGR